MCNWKISLLVAAVTLLAACGSTPQSNHYMLSTIGEGTSGNTGPSLGVGPISVPQYLDRNAMVINEDDNKLKIAAFDRWAEPLGDGIQRVLSLNLAELLNTQQVQTFPWPRSSKPRFGIEINVVEFSAKGQSTRLIAKWMLRDLEKDIVLEQKIVKFSTQAKSAEPASIAAAYSELLAMLSREIAGRIPGVDS